MLSAGLLGFLGVFAADLLGGLRCEFVLYSHSIRKNITNKIIGSNFKNNVLKRKIAEALLIEQKHPSLSVQDQSVELNLLN